MKNALIEFFKWLIKWIAVGVGTVILIIFIVATYNSDSFRNAVALRQNAIKCEEISISENLKELRRRYTAIEKAQGKEPINFLEPTFAILKKDYIENKVILVWASQFTETGLGDKARRYSISPTEYTYNETVGGLRKERSLERDTLIYKYIDYTKTGDIDRRIIRQCEIVPFDMFYNKVKEYKEKLKSRQKI